MCAAACGGQKRVVDPLALEFQVIVSCLVVGTDSTPLEEQPMLLSAEPFLQPSPILSFVVSSQETSSRQEGP